MNDGNSAPHADRYAWAAEFLDSAYCVTVVIGLDPGAALARLGVKSGAADLRLPDVVERAYQAWDSLPRKEDEELFVASTQLGGNSVMVEPNGYLCSVEEFLRPLSKGTAVFSFYVNVNSQSQFTWYADGEMQLWFDPLWPTDRDGPAAEAAGCVLAEVGFDLDAEFEARPEAASLALVESLAGIRLTSEGLSSAVYCGGLARFRSSQG